MSPDLKSGTEVYTECDSSVESRTHYAEGSPRGEEKREMSIDLDSRGTQEIKGVSKMIGTRRENSVTTEKSAEPTPATETCGQEKLPRAPGKWHRRLRAQPRQRMVWSPTPEGGRPQM